MDEEDYKFLYGVAETEEEEPLDPVSNSDNLEEYKLKAQENDKRRKEKRYFSAFKLFIGCLIFLGCIYAVGVIVSAVLVHDISEVKEGIIEIIKTLLFTLSGYLFARKENGD